MNLRRRLLLQGEGINFETVDKGNDTYAIGMCGSGYNLTTDIPSGDATYDLNFNSSSCYMYNDFRFLGFSGRGVQSV